MSLSILCFWSRACLTCVLYLIRHSGLPFEGLKMGYGALRKPDAPFPTLALEKHSTQKQGWSPGEKAKEPQVGGRAAGSQGMPED